MAAIGWTLLRKFWYVPVIAALAFGLWVQHKDVKFERAQRAAAEVALKQAEEVNERNAQFIKRQNEDIELARKATERAIADAKTREAQTNAAKEEMRNAPGAADTVSPYFDALGDKLRSLNAAPSH